MKRWVHSEELAALRFPESLPFKAERSSEAYRRARSMGLLEGSDRAPLTPTPLTWSEAARFHSLEYLEALRLASEGVGHIPGALAMGLDGPDTPTFAGMLELLLLASGGTVAGARAILAGEAELVFAPAGGFHHAHAARASGFCYMADGVLAMQELVAAGRRVLYLDIDAHHGDGPEAAFYDSAEVMTISLHQSGRTLFPGSGFEEDIGVGAGRGFAANLPLPPGTDDQAYLRAFHEGAWPLIEAFSADVVVVEVGMDTLAGDPLTMMRLTNQAPMEVLECVRQLGKPMLATGGGGYHFENTVRGWVLAWSVLCGDQAEHDALAMSMGGVMMQSDDWVGGLRDRALPRDPSSAELVDREVERMLQRLKRSLFDLHGLPH